MRNSKRWGKGGRGLTKGENCGAVARGERDRSPLEISLDTNGEGDLGGFIKEKENFRGERKNWIMVRRASSNASGNNLIATQL